MHTLLWPDYFAEGAKSFGKLSKILLSHFEVTCYPYKEIHVTGKMGLAKFKASGAQLARRPELAASRRHTSTLM